MKVPERHLVEGHGSMYPGRRSNAASRKEQVALESATQFRNLDARTEPSSDLGGPYAVKDAAHAHDRIEERTPLHRSHADLIQRAVDMLGLPPEGSYHLPLRGRGGVLYGYAQFKGVANRPRPVLATVLGPQMRPGGQNIEDLIGGAISAPKPIDPLDPRGPRPHGLRPSHPGREESDGHVMDRMFHGVDQPIPDTIEAE